MAGIPRAFADPLPGGPRYFVTLFLRGGIDGVLTIDPKVKADVDADVDLPYGPDAIVDAGAVQLGPHFAKLKPYADKMAVVKGFQVHVANHESGAYQLLRMRTAVTANIPSLHEILGQRREQPLASVVLGDLSSFDYSAGSIVAPTGGGGTTSLDAMDKLSDDELAMLARSYKKHLARYPSSGLSERDLRTKEHLSQVTAFFDRSKDVPRFKAKDWGVSRDTAHDLQRTLWFLENDMARGVSVKIQFDWDSHFRNADKQAGANATFTQLLTKFLDELASRRNKYGSLAEQTVLIVGSELGRFPVLNGNEGKDHFPETGLIVMGPGIKPGTYGQTGKRMQGMKTSMKTGKADDVGGRKLELDDLGVTLLSMAGYKPEVYGYRGQRMAFLEG